MIDELDEVLRKFLIREVPIKNGDVDIKFDMPKREWSARLNRPTLNLFLYDIRENAKLRQAQPMWRSSATRTRPSSAQAGPARPVLHDHRLGFRAGGRASPAEPHPDGLFPPRPPAGGSAAESFQASRCPSRSWLLSRISCRTRPTCGAHWIMSCGRRLCAFSPWPLTRIMSSPPAWCARVSCASARRRCRCGSSSSGGPPGPLLDHRRHSAQRQAAGHGGVRLTSSSRGSGGSSARWPLYHWQSEGRRLHSGGRRRRRPATALQGHRSVAGLRS